MLARAGVEETQARAWAERIAQGALLLGVHATSEQAAGVHARLADNGASEVITASWPE